MKNKAAQALGRMGRGIPKDLTQAERKRRSDWMKRINAQRKRKK